MKYDCIKERLTELGKTQANLAAYAGITQQKLNVTLNHPELREFQIAEIVKVAEFLQYDLSDFVKYVAGDPSVPTPTKLLSKHDDDILARNISRALGDCLKEKHIALSPDGWATVFNQLYKSKCQDKQTIGAMLSGMLLANSELLTKVK